MVIFLFRALTLVLHPLPPMHLSLIPGLFMLSTILPQRRQVVPRCLDSWAEPQQVYRLQFRGLAATTAGDGRVMRPYDPG